MLDHHNLVAALEKLTTADLSEAEQDALISHISSGVNDPAWMDHLYQSDAFVGADGVLDLDGLSRKILSYHAIRL